MTPEVSFGGQVEQGLGIAAVVEVAPEPGVHREHDGVEVVTLHRLGLRRGVPKS